MDNWRMWLAAGLAVILCAACIGSCLWIYMRRRYIAFTEEICTSIDRIIDGEGVADILLEEDTLLSKVHLKLCRLSGITKAAVCESEEQKQQVQSIVSDISHQLKTPIANITMYCDTAMRAELTEEMRKQCLAVLEKQVKKLDSLIQSLIQMSRLENNIIVLHPQDNSLKNTLYEVVESIRPRARKKKLDIHMECPEGIRLRYDEKWTAEAMFNIVDNSVKYTGDGGKLRIDVEPLEIYTKICIADNGIGIAAEHINDVCKRFYREEKSRTTEGVGIGLYLTREIIMKQHGYLKIHSEEGAGTRVSVYLPN